MGMEQGRAQLVDMGFSAAAAERALLRAGGGVERALDLLVAEQASGEEQKDNERDLGGIMPFV